MNYIATGILWILIAIVGGFIAFLGVIGLGFIGLGLWFVGMILWTGVQVVLGI